MRRRWLAWFCFGLGGVTLGFGGATGWQALHPPPVPQFAAHFNPKGNITDALVSAIDQSQQEIQVQAYGFTSPPIIDALLHARTRGVQVSVLLDKSNEQPRYPAAHQLARAGIPVRIDHKPAIAHNKIILIDGKTVITGSFNFTLSAEKRNAENCLFVSGQQTLFQQYSEYFGARWEQSRPVRPIKAAVPKV